MPDAKRILRLFPSLFLLLVSAAGCNFFDKDGDGRARIEFGTGTAAGSTIDVSGGAGTVGAGGDGDQETGIWLDAYGPGGVKVYRDGAADASFTPNVPAATPDFGSEPLTVTADMTIPVYDADPADNNVYYFLWDDSTLYHKIDDSTINAVTGIRVNAGVTLTLPVSADRDGNWLYDSSYLFLENDLEVLGSLRSAAFDNPDSQESGESIDRAGLVLNTSGGVFIRSSGVVSTAADNATSGRGGDGGAIEFIAYASESPNSGIVVNEGRIDASGGRTDDLAAQGGRSAAYGAYDYCVNLYADTRLVNTGSIRADGGRGGSGGQTGGWYGNAFYVGGPGTLENSGPISMSGGAGNNGDGGSGGDLDMVAGQGYLHNSGAITLRGGDGSGNGGMGGYIDIYVDEVGDLLNSGAVAASGGDSTGTDNAVATIGGRGGQVYLWTHGGALISSGGIAADGGDVANGNSGSSGGGGGYVDIESYPDYLFGASPAGAMEISGNILARGGAGPNGAYGGAVYMQYGDANGSGGIVLRGYAALVNDGGDGVPSGGGGGGVYLEDWYSGGAAGAGGLLTEADVSADGGDADTASGSGGYGGYVEIYSSTPPSQYRGAAADGGAGASPGGAGTVSIDGGSVPL